jgi:hypothetical protein
MLKHSIEGIEETGWPDGWIKNSPNFYKSSQNSHQAKKCQISTSKLNLEVPKTLFKL